jgi:cytoskeletal protein RodZ
MQEQRAFGKYLRSERELRQITLAEVSSATKIPLLSLERLEQGCWEGLPATVFVKGFVRCYAKHVGFSQEEACRRFGEVLSGETAPEVREVSQQPASGEPITEAASKRFGLALFLIIVLIIATITLSLLWRMGASADTHVELEGGDPGSPSALLRG